MTETAPEDPRRQFAAAVLAAGAPVLVIAAPGAGATTWLTTVAEVADGPVWMSDASVARPGGRTALGDLLGRRRADMVALRPAERALLERCSAGETNLSEGIDALVELAHAGGGRFPSVWLIDRFDLLDPTTADFVEHLVDAGVDTPLVVATARGAAERWRGGVATLPSVATGELERQLARHGASPSVAARLAHVADGNPTVAEGFARMLTSDELSGAARLPTPLPLADGILAAAHDLIAALAVTEREALGRLAAMVEAGDRAALDGVSPRWLGDAFASLEDASERRARHLELARCADGAAVLVHRSIGLDRVDEKLATELTEHAERLLSMGEPAAAEVYLVAALGSVDEPARRSSLARVLAIDASLTGHPGAAARWTGVAQRYAAADARVQALSEGAARRGVVTRAQRDRLRAVIAERADAPIDELAPLIVQCLVIGLLGCMPGLLDDAAVAADRYATALAADPAVACSAEASFVALGVAYVRHLAACDPGAGAAVVAATPVIIDRLAHVEQLPAIDSVESSPTRAGLYYGIAAVADGRWDDADTLLVRSATVEERNGWLGFHATTAGWLAELRWRQGRWAESDALVRKVLGSTLLDSETAAMVRAVAARSGALRTREAAYAVTEPGGDADETGIWTVVWHHGMALAALGQLDHIAASAHLRRAEAIMGPVVRHPGLVWWPGDLVEALAHSGDRPAAEQALARFERDAAPFDTPTIALARARARAACQRGQSAVRLLTDALDDAGAGAAPFEVARTRLELSYECRSVDLAASRRHAEIALAALDELAAVGFADQARQLAGTALTDPAVAARALTDRGRQLAGLVAGGATNRELARTTGLSEKTVEFHLGKVFRTINVARRAELAALFAGYQPLVR